MVKQIFNKRTKRGMAVLMAAAMVGTMAPVSMPTQPTWTVQAATATKELSKTPTVVSATAINYVNETLTLDWNDDVDANDKTDTVYYAIVTNKNFDETTFKTFPKASAYEAVEKDEMTDIDLSWANLTKDKTYLFVTTDTDATKVKPAWVELAKQNTKLKISYLGSAKKEAVEAKTAIGDSENGYLIIDEKSNDDKITFDMLEYRTEYGSAWTPVKDNLTSLKRYTTKGATLQMRVKATTTNPAGKTIKVKVTAKAKAPKVTVDYINQTVKLAKGVQVATGGASATTNGIIQEGKWVTNADKAKTMQLSTELGYDGTPMKVYVRTAANGKKAPSKVTVIKLGAPVDAPEAVVATDGAVKPDTTKGKISIDYATPYDISKGVQLTNNSDKPLQFAIVKKDADAIEAGCVDPTKVASLGVKKWTSVAAATESNGNLKSKTAKLDKTSDEAGTKIKEIKLEDLEKYMVVYRTADKKATVISEVVAVDMPTKLAQEIIAKTDKVASVKAVTVTTKSGVAVTSELTLSGRVAEKSSYTVSIFETTKDQAGNYVPTTKKSSKITAKYDKNTKKLSIDGTKNAAEGENFIVTVKCEGATLNILVTIGKETEVGASGTASTGGSGNENTVTFTSQTTKFTTDVEIYSITDASGASPYATVEKSSDDSYAYVITSLKPGTFSFKYDENTREATEHTVNVTIAEDGSITTSES